MYSSMQTTGLNVVHPGRLYCGMVDVQKTYSIILESRSTGNALDLFDLFG